MTTTLTCTCADVNDIGTNYKIAFNCPIDYNTVPNKLITTGLDGTLKTPVPMVTDEENHKEAYNNKDHDDDDNKDKDEDEDEDKSDESDDNDFKDKHDKDDEDNKDNAEDADDVEDTDNKDEYEDKEDLLLARLKA